MSLHLENFPEFGDELGIIQLLEEPEIPILFLRSGFCFVFAAGLAGKFLLHISGEDDAIVVSVLAAVDLAAMTSVHIRMSGSAKTLFVDADIGRATVAENDSLDHQKMI
jgi:hypothetical protein